MAGLNFAKMPSSYWFNQKLAEAFCKCKGGRNGGCKHFSAALYLLDALLNSTGECCHSLG
jgi:uncharacterized Zn finger protein